MATEYTTKEAILALSEPDPELTAFLASTRPPHLDWSDIHMMRNSRQDVAAQRFAGLGNPGEIYHVPMRDGFKSQVRVYKPAVATAASPLVVLIYGGGFITGDNRSPAGYAMAIAKLYGATVVLPSYRLAPENKFPVPQNDVWDTLVWATTEASALGADPAAGFVLGGTSAGGNLAAVMGQKWADEGRSPRITGLWLNIPAIFAKRETVPEEYRADWLSPEQNATALFVNAEALVWVHKHLGVDMDSPLYSPFNSPNPDKHANLKPARVYFQVAGQDPLRDDALIYERVLRRAGVETKMDVYPGVPHGHYGFFPTFASAKKSTVDVVQGHAWLLRKEEPLVEDVAKLMTGNVASGGS